MPELPDIIIYLEQLETRVAGRRLETIRVTSPFLVRTYDPPLDSAHGKHVLGLRRMSKRIVFGLEDDLFLVLHLMIAGRLHWKPPGARIPAKSGLAPFAFDTGTLLLTEAGTKKRASLCLVRGENELKQYDPGGLDVLSADLDSFRESLMRENHTLKRSLTDPRSLARDHARNPAASSSTSRSRSTSRRGKYGVSRERRTSASGRDRC